MNDSINEILSDNVSYGNWPVGDTLGIRIICKLCRTLNQPNVIFDPLHAAFQQIYVMLLSLESRPNRGKAFTHIITQEAYLAGMLAASPLQIFQYVQHNVSTSEFIFQVCVRLMPKRN